MIIIIIIIGIVCYSIYLLCLYSNYRYRYSLTNNQSYEYATTMNGKQFKNIYMLDPSKWRYSKVMDPNYTLLATDGKFLLYNATGDWSLRRDILIPEPYQFQNKNEIVRVHLGFFAWLYYIRFKKLFDKTEMNKGMEIILKSAQNDIDKLKAQAQQEIYDANKMMKFITKRGK